MTTEGEPKHSTRQIHDQETSWLTVSDWVTFLASEKQGTTSSFLGVAAVLVALVALVYSTGSQGWIVSVVITVVVVGLLAFVNFRVFCPLRKRSERAEKIFDRILSGDLRYEKDIRKAWEQRELTSRLRKKAAGSEGEVKAP